MSAYRQRGLLSKLAKFVAKRFASDYQSNIQFDIDLRSCGLSHEDLGEVLRLDWQDFPFYVWPLPELDGYVLAEFGGRLFLMPEYLPLPACLVPHRTSPLDATDEVRS